MYRLLPPLALSLVCVACAAPHEEVATLLEPAAATMDSDAIVTAVEAVLSDQVIAWNEGDIDGFMVGYWNDPGLRFASGGSVHRGWQETLARYHQRYPDRAAMGTLAFEDIEVKPLSPEWAMAFGRYVLERESDRPTGLFTLLFERQADGSGGEQWRIVHDHTSAAEE